MALARIQDPDLVIDKLHLLERGVGAGQRLAKRRVDSVHRTVAKGHLVIDDIADSDGRRGLRFDNQLTTGVEAALVHHPETADVEIIRHLAERAACQQLEAGFGGIKGPAVKLAFLDHPDQLVEAGVGGIDLDAEFGKTRQHVRLAGLVRDQILARIADLLGRHMLVCARVLLRCRGVKPALVRKSRFTDIGRLRVRRTVQALVEHARQLHQLRQVFLGDTGLVAKLQHKSRDQADQVRIATPLAKPVDRALHLTCACADRRQRIRHCHPGIIMAMDAEPCVRHSLAHRADNLEHFRGQRAAIGIAQHHPGRAALMRRFHTIDGIAGVVFVAVEEMLAIEHRFTALVHGGGNRPADHVQIFLEACLDRSFDMEVPGLADKAGGRNLGIENSVQARIVCSTATTAAGHAKGNHTRIAGLRR